ncbi:MAG TPA: hypothetical protein PLR41_11025 [Alphaproteobacteria bacterium]|nr:hypothetical protein [Alphaproteobacteria bacterium]
MMRRLSLLAVSGLIAACVPVEHSAERVAIETEIHFVDSAGRPLVNEPVYLIETLPFAHYITQVLHTDAEGGVHLNDTYCAPIAVMVDGGEIVLSSIAGSDQTVVVNASRQPRVQSIYGEPIAGYTTLRRSASYLDCKPPAGPI